MGCLMYLDGECIVHLKCARRASVVSKFPIEQPARICNAAMAYTAIFHTSPLVYALSCLINVTVAIVLLPKIKNYGVV